MAIAPLYRRRFIRHTHPRRDTQVFNYPCDPGRGYWVHDAHTGDALEGPFPTMQAARQARRDMLGMAAPGSRSRP